MTSHPRTLSATLLLLFTLTMGAAAQIPSAAPIDERGIPTLAPILRDVMPAVVTVLAGAPPRDADPGTLDERVPPGERGGISGGSGVIVDARNGYVLTNHHVIAAGGRIAVTLEDRRTIDATLVGSDPGTDIALLKIDARGLRALPMGDSDRLKVGDFVLAIGNPFGLGKTVTSGIVSALGRGRGGPDRYTDFIQTDASINPGNSGGALVSLDGKLAGINTAIISPAGGNVGIGFAVPVNMARVVMDQLLRFGEIDRGRLGVLIRDFTPDLAEPLRASSETVGAVVTEVLPGSPAEAAGLRQDDVVVKLDGRPVNGSSDLRNRIGLMRVGTDIELTILRGGDQRTIRAQIGRAS